MTELQNTDVAIKRCSFNLKTNEFCTQKLIIGICNGYFIDVTYFVLFFEAF
jgi:hypothetical protein